MLNDAAIKKRLFLTQYLPVVTVYPASDILIRSMSALDSPPPPCFNHSLEADGLSEGAHMPSMLCLANGFGNDRRVGVMSDYLFTLFAASMLLLLLL